MFDASRPPRVFAVRVPPRRFPTAGAHVLLPRSRNPIWVFPALTCK
jgi:hypothetical protein